MYVRIPNYYIPFLALQVRYRTLEYRTSNGDHGIGTGTAIQDHTYVGMHDYYISSTALPVLVPTGTDTDTDTSPLSLWVLFLSFNNLSNSLFFFLNSLDNHFMASDAKIGHGLVGTTILSSKKSRPAIDEQGEFTLLLWVLFVSFNNLSNSLFIFFKLLLINILWHLIAMGAFCIF